jgi:polynucleotide 5'-kinase involved in rRNA processing
MKHAPRLYDVVLELIRQCPSSDLRHGIVLAWMVVGMIESGRSNLTHWISSVQTNALYAQSTQRRFCGCK